MTVGESGMAVLVKVGVDGRVVGVALGTSTVGVGEAGTNVLVGWVVGGIEVAVA